MPVKREIPVPEVFFKNPRPRKASVFECLLDLDNAWDFVPGVDFKKGVDPQKFISRARSWKVIQKLRHLGLRSRVHKDGTVTIQFYELTQEEMLQRDKVRLRFQKARAAEQLAAE